MPGTLISDRPQVGSPIRNPAALADSYMVNAEGFHSWTDGEIAAYRDAHPTGTMARLALEIFLGTGAARQDAAALTRSNIRGGEIHDKRGKTGRAVAVPIVPELASELSLIPADRLVLLVNGLGNPMNSRGLGRAFAAWCAKAGLPGNCRAHGQRKAGARWLAEAGATEHQIMSFLRHANPAMAARYTAAANRGTRAARSRTRSSWPASKAATDTAGSTASGPSAGTMQE